MNFLHSFFFRKILRYKISWKSVQWEPSRSIRTDGRTDMKKPIIAFRSFANAAENVVDSVHKTLFLLRELTLLSVRVTIVAMEKQEYVPFSGAFAKLWKATISFVMSVRLPACLPVWNNSASLDGFHEIWYWAFFEKKTPHEKIQVSVEQDKNNGYFTGRPIYIFYHISPNSS